MPDDPDALVSTLDDAEDAFGGYALGGLDSEEGLDPTAHDADVIQLRKACRLLDACRVLREHDGYHTSVIEMSFAAIERTLECLENGRFSILPQGVIEPFSHRDHGTPRIVSALVASNYTPCASPTKGSQPTASGR
ncbi:hypothetical protein SAMN05216559_3727 [Halomicrobium zhouii]|uniref:DUF8154 domain-containing protein n=1 Tax=Halomicrobium zhouii TaxID=767519 RepID=A0A1I6M442_9EURY|nr:hypothetical protein [Halomicrobium zhouii]SFS10423.1 hypothetical protein SAMN05216559_3727 [Halomicrobium zhouii]